MISYLTTKGKINLKVCEDSLTAAVFDGLKYLPSALFYKILKNSLYNDKLPSVSGELNEILFWEKWNANQTFNSNFVEPDLLLQFDHFDIIIEAKRYDLYQQSQTQLENEIKAYYNVFDGEKEMFFIQLGGLNNKNNEPDFILEEKQKRVKICKTDWYQLLNQITVELHQLENNPNIQSIGHKRVLKDIIKAFEIHQFYQIKWFNELKQINLNQTHFKPMEFLKK